MKKMLFLLSSFPALAFAQEKGIQFARNMSWEQVKAKAKAEHKYIMMDCYTTWCGWCKYMDNNVYPNDTVGKAANANFVAVRVQFDSSKNDNDEVKSWYATAHEFAGKYNVRAYPTLLFFNSDGEIVDQHVGAALKTSEFVTVLDNAKDPSKQYFVLKRKFDNGDKDPAFLKDFANTAMGAYDMKTASEAAKAYIATQTNLYTKDNLTFLSNFTQSSKDTGFAIMNADPEKVDAVLGKDAAEKTVRNIVFREVAVPEIFPRNPNIKKAEDLPEPDWASLQSELKGKYPNISDEVLAYSKVTFYETKKDWNNFEPAVVAYMKDYGEKASDEQLNNFAWTVFQNCPDMTCVTQALDWSKKSFQNNNNPMYMDTYANILYKMGKKDEAVAWEQKARDAASGDEKDGYQKTINKMNAGEKTWN